jgi:polyvinyl alcohol dehydrogenase (cytochrome)
MEMGCNDRAHAWMRRCVILAAVLAAWVFAAPAGAATWSMFGQGVTNWRYQPDENKINANNAGGLKPKWATALGGDISATPAVVDGFVYVPDWGGKITKLNAATGAVVWQKDVGALSGVAGAKSRTSPAVVGNAVIFGTQAGARLVSIDKTTGNTNWATTLDSHMAAIITQSPVVHNGTIYNGVASLEEGLATVPGYPCCTFRGSAVAVDLATGAIKWKTYMTTPPADPDNPLDTYSGAAVWSSTPTIDVKRNSVYYTTGNNYDAPAVVLACEDAWKASGMLTPDPCEPAGNGNYVDAVLSLDMTTGAIKWSRKLQGFDAWTVACIPGFSTSCPSPYGPDYDFAQGAMLIPTKKGDVVVAGQKSGVMWGLDANDGHTLWGTSGGPGSSLGGMEWGSATDGKRVYFAIVNLFGIPQTLVNPPKGTPTSSSAGLWGAIDPATGAILWQTADPNGSIALGPVSVANGVLYAGSMGKPLAPGGGFLLGPSAGKPTMLALDAANGKTLWSFDAGTSVNASPAIVDGTLFWGSGYANIGLGDPGNLLYAFSR